MMQAVYFIAFGWQQSDEQKDSNFNFRLDEKSLMEMVKYGMALFMGDEDKSLGGAPAEFLPQMLMEDNPVHSFPILN